jgi:putative two-component system response regulator
LHDIGKIALPDSILHKHDPLTEEERKQLEMHPGIGADMFARYKGFARGAAIVRGHHERWDGMGYPDGLARSDIPFGARVIAVTDSFDAMTSDRPYRRGMSVDQAVVLLRRGRGTQWDPHLVDAFTHLVDTQADGVAAADLTIAQPILALA